MPRRRPTPDAERMRRYRARLRRGVAFVPVPINARRIDYLVREGLLPPGREVASRGEIGVAIAAALDRLARSE